MCAVDPIGAGKFYERKRRAEELKLLRDRRVGPIYQTNCRGRPLPLHIYLTWSAYRADLVAIAGASGYEFILHMKGKAATPSTRPDRF
jgi:hypothetical protein